MSKYMDMVLHYEGRIAKLEKEVAHWRDSYVRKSSERDREAASLAGKCEIYEMVLKKFLDAPTDNTDEIFMFEGKIFKPISFNMTREPYQEDTLTVDFTRIPIDI